MSLCEKNIDCLECKSRGMCESYAHFKYNQAIDECINIVQAIKDDYNDSRFGEQKPINYGTICGIIIAMQKLRDSK